MENYKLILPEHMNHYGYLYGGNMMKWADEYAYIAASIDFPGERFVTVGMERVEFKEGVSNGDILRFVVSQVKAGRTSVAYHVDVMRATGGEAVAGRSLFSTTVTFVCVGESGKKQALRSLLK